MTTHRFGFSCTIKLIIFFILIPSYVYSGHKFVTTYTGVHGQTAPELSAVTILDGQQIDFYDSNVNNLIPKQNWMKKITSTELWTKYTEIREKQHQIYRNNIRVLMETLNQAHGDHAYQRICGCVWNDETGESQGFDQYVYDGEDFISLDLKENRYIASVAQALPTVMKWNNDRAQLKYLKQYYDHECVNLLKEFLSKAAEPETIPKTEDQITPSDDSNNFYLPVIIPVTVVPILLLGVSGLFLWKHRDELKAYCKKKTEPSPAPAVESLLSPGSNECPSPPEAVTPHGSGMNNISFQNLHSSSPVEQSSQL